MNFGRENVKQYVDELDLLNLWVRAGEPTEAEYELPERTTVETMALRHFDLDSAAEVARGGLSVPADGETTWTTTYNVGPETYGRPYHFEEPQQTVQTFLEAGIRDGRARSQCPHSVTTPWLCSVSPEDLEHD
jgi:hypothetical protein